MADDEVMIRNLVTILLQDQGYVVLSASDGQEGLDLCTHLLEPFNGEALLERVRVVLNAPVQSPKRQ